MRFDSMGIFWQDVHTERRKGVPIQRSMPPIPQTCWTPPKDFPNLSTAKVISIDTETFDPELITRGPGWARGIGNLCGASVAVETGHSWYFPMRHTVETENNLDPVHVLNWLKDTLCNPQQDKVGANLLYDIGWLAEEGVAVAGKCWDVQFAEALLTETGDVNLNHLGEKYEGFGKETSDLYLWCSQYYGGLPNEKQRANIYRSPPSLVGPYAISDATLPLAILYKQWPLLEQQGLLNLFDMECRLIPLLIKMRSQGVTVDIDRAEQLQVTLKEQSKEKRNLIKNMVGFDVDPWAAESIARAFQKVGLSYPVTATNKPSFRADFLENLHHPLATLIREYRERDKLSGTFIQSYILDSHVNGKVYCQFHPMRGKEGGTRSGRFSSSTPNLQNIPSRTELGKLLRQMFIPDIGHKQWRKYDYSQIEYRFLAHFATGMGSDLIRSTYSKDPNTDYHQALTNLIKDTCAIELDRKPTKTINFGLTYGMGKPKLIRSLGLSAAEGNKLFNAYHTGAPFVHHTMNETMTKAQNDGYITTILGRRSRFDLWEPSERGVQGIALPFEAALVKYGRVKRAYTHKALNRVLQGSSADQLKLAMLMCYESGLFDYIGYPRVTVHDELGFSDFGGVDDGFAELKRVMENCIKLRIPILAEESCGINWGMAA